MIKLLERRGFVVCRQRGSLFFLKRGETGTVVPLHKELDRNTRMGILRQCGLTKSDLEHLL
ncbi:MAG TPA: type II toxin-antitoxin system HicA family toxin [Candidatus Sumerlaeota bacterium]|nr:type II toxin-antitoxin system HicA family toxin [Candidatus Sumerlaeota bacterium]